MPELPEVETVLRGLLPHMKDAHLDKVQLNRPNLRYAFPLDFVKRLEGRKILDLQRRAKYIVFDLDSADQMVLHLGMSGRVQVSCDGYSPKKHDHAVFYLSNGVVISYNDPRRFGFIDLLQRSQIQSHRAFARLGPEPFSNAFSHRYLWEKLKQKDSPIKTALLDQSLVAGLGNIYVCEVLFLAKIHPSTPCRELSLKQLEEIVSYVQKVLQEAIEAGGSTLRDHKQPSGEMGYFQHNFKVYGRENKPCSVCMTPIWRSVQAGRSSFYCPTCQSDLKNLAG